MNDPKVRICLAITVQRPPNARPTDPECCGDLAQAVPLALEVLCSSLPLRWHDGGPSSHAALRACVSKSPTSVFTDGVNAELNEDGHDAEECSPHGCGGVDFRFTERFEMHSPLPQLVHELQGHHLASSESIQCADNKSVALAEVSLAR